MDKLALTRRQLLALLSAATGINVLPAWAAESEGVAPQPYFAAVNRALEALAKLGSPIAAKDAQQLATLARQGDRAAIDAAEKILDRYTLARVVTDSDGFAHTAAGGAQRTLIEQGWSVLLVRVSNAVGTTAKLNVSGGGATLTTTSTGASRAGVPDTLNAAPNIARVWFRSEMYQSPPIGSGLSGGPLEYQVVQLYSRDRGSREATVDFFTSTEQYAEYFAASKKTRRSSDI